jgi:23S rRNA pseudouridine1911/1915/1917 synthase
VLIGAGAVSRNGVAVLDAGLRVKAGDIFAVAVPAPVPAEPVPQAMPLAIVYEDRDIIVIDKPKGLAVHPGPGHASGTLVNALIAHCGTSLSGIGGVRRPGIVHRLDKDTTGLLAIAKSDRAHQGLAEQFAAHGTDGRLQRGYRAIAWGAPERPSGTIEAALARSVANRTKIAVVRANSAGGRRAVTHYETLERFGGRPGGAVRPVASLLRLVLETGRTHQVRVHLAHIGHPLLGDPVYGAGHKASARKLNLQAQAALAALERQALHAAELEFLHPVSGKRLTFESALPPDLAALVAGLRRQDIE